MVDEHTGWHMGGKARSHSSTALTRLLSTLRGRSYCVSVAKNFLEANNVPTAIMISTQSVSNPDLADRAKAFTAFVACPG